MSRPRRSLDDTCNIFLSRRRTDRSHFPHHRTATQSGLPDQPPSLCPESLTIAPYFDFLPRHLEVPGIPCSALALTSGSAKPLPLPGSSGTAEPRAPRLTNGRHHVPRPRNPFILFRCDLVHQRKTLPRSDLDDTNISRIAGDLWREMTAAQKKPWLELAAKEKERHALLYPDYKYAPSHGGTKGKRARDESDSHSDGRLPRQISQASAASASSSSSDRHSRTRHQHERPRPYPRCVPRRRSSSCPPVGAVPVPSHSPADEWAPPLVTRDDLERRPSRAVMYQSAASQSQPVPAVVEPTVQTAPAPASYDHLLVPSHDLDFDWLNTPQADPSLMDLTSYPLFDVSHSLDSYPVPNFAFFDGKPTITNSTSDHSFTTQELAELERLAIGATFTDPFSTQTALNAVALNKLADLYFILFWDVFKLMYGWQLNERNIDNDIYAQYASSIENRRHYDMNIFYSKRSWKLDP